MRSIDGPTLTEGQYDGGYIAATFERLDWLGFASANHCNSGYYSYVFCHFGHVANGDRSKHDTSIRRTRKCAAGDVVRALEQRGATFDVRGGSIFVDSSQRDELRMTLASEGLPANSTSGYELLDSLSGFGTTSQMFDAAYWRAKEGELARTIVASSQFAMARVHIASTGSNPFQRGITPKASVSVTPMEAK